MDKSIIDEDDRPKRRPNQTISWLKTKITQRVIADLVLFLLVLWFGRPLWHFLVFDVVYLDLPFFIALVIAGIAVLSMFKSSKWAETKVLIAAVMVVFMILIVAFGGALSGSALVSGINPASLQKLPETTGIRYLPMEVAHANTKATMNDPLYGPGDTHPFDYGGDLSYITPRLPNGFMNSWTKEANGAVVVFSNGTQKTIEQPFVYGEGMIVTDNMVWRLLSQKYWCSIPQIYYVFDDNSSELLALAPYETYYLSFPELAYGIRLPVFVPQWGGVFVVHGSGKIEDLSPGEAIADARFKNQRLYPEDLARTIGDAWQYRNGVINAFMYHVDQPEMADATDTGNQMPYLVPIASGFVWFNGFKPSGQSESIYKVQFINAHNGSISIYNVPSNQNLAGPQKSIGFVKTAFPSISWDTIKAVEPRPIVHDGALYWQISITNSDNSGIYKTALVDSKVNSVSGNTQVMSFDSKSGLDDFLADKGVTGSSASTAITNNHMTAKVTTNDNALQLDYRNMTDQQLIQTAHEALNELDSRQVK